MIELGPKKKMLKSVVNRGDRSMVKIKMEPILKSRKESSIKVVNHFRGDYTPERS